MTSPLHFAQHGALIAGREDLRALVVSGPDRIAWLMGMLSCDLAPVEQNRAVYGLILDKQGKIIADLVVLQHDDRLVLAVDGKSAAALQEHLDRFLIMEDAEIEVLDEPHSFLFALGPRCAEVGTAALAVDAVLAARPGHLYGTDGALLFVQGSEAEKTALTLAEGDPDFGVVSADTYDALRFELGIPKFAADFGPANYPMEIGLDEHAISFSKGCYVGQEVVVKLRSRGKPVRVLKRLVFDAGEPPEPGAVVTLSEGKEVGKVTTAGQTTAGKSVAFALLRRADAESAQKVLVAGNQATLASAWGCLDG